MIARADPYAYPSGYRYRPFRRGDRFPATLLLASWMINDLAFYSLDAPPAGYRWVRYGPDAVLVNSSSYMIRDTEYGVFDDGSARSYAGGGEPPSVDPDLPQDFLTGELSLGDDSRDCDDILAASDRADDMDAAWRDEDWNQLALDVVDARCGSDLSWYLLGLAAEGLMLPDAAAAYYRAALYRVDGDDDDFRCSAWGDDACRGLDIGREASAGLERLYRARS